jgi:hypothetical protein
MIYVDRERFVVVRQYASRASAPVRELLHS